MFIHLLTVPSAERVTEQVSEQVRQQVTQNSVGTLHQVSSWLSTNAVSFGLRVLTAIVIFVVGRFLIGFINKLVAKLLSRRHVDVGVQGFVKSLVSILLTVLLIVAVISQLGIETTSFAALLASAGVAVGMALSGNLQNFAGGLLILLFRPYKVGDYIECQGQGGTVREIQIFYTILVTPENKVVYLPNGPLSSGTVVNYSQEGTRRVDWTVSVEYGEDYERVERVLRELVAADERILTDPEPVFALLSLGDSSVNVVMRVWVATADYWNVYLDMNKKIYSTFNQAGIGFPFPQLTVHQAE
jgi:hypothetical protein